MNSMQIPLYRAKEISSDKYVEGYVSPQGYKGCDGLYIYLEDSLDECYEIDPTTLAIHFKGMLDSEGNKIFASLSKDSKSGDIICNIKAPNNFGEMKVFFNIHRNAVCYDESGGELQYLVDYELKNYKIIGIKGENNGRYETE